jgi:hypothetical protein
VDPPRDEGGTTCPAPPPAGPGGDEPGVGGGVEGVDDPTPDGWDDPEASGGDEPGEGGAAEGVDDPAPGGWDELEAPGEIPGAAGAADDTAPGEGGGAEEVGSTISRGDGCEDVGAVTAWRREGPST